MHTVLSHYIYYCVLYRTQVSHWTLSAYSVMKLQFHHTPPHIHLVFSRHDFYSLMYVSTLHQTVRHINSMTYPYHSTSLKFFSWNTICLLRHESTLTTTHIHIVLSRYAFYCVLYIYTVHHAVLHMDSMTYPYPHPWWFILTYFIPIVFFTPHYSFLHSHHIYILFLNMYPTSRSQCMTYFHAFPHSQSISYSHSHTKSSTLQHVYIFHIPRI